MVPPLLRRAPVQVLALIVVAAVLRIILTAQRDLPGVEAYLWLWTQRPALSYFDHPAMQAWIATPSVALLGATPLGVRGFFILTASLSIWLTFLAGRRLYGERTGVVAAFLVGLVPMLFTGMVEGKPDAPLLFFWAATIWALSHALSEDSPRWWIAAGLFLGLAMDSKYHAAFLALGITGFLTFSPDQRAWFRRKEPWIGVAVSLLAFAPTVIWNATHGWQSFLYHGVTRTMGEGSTGFKQIANFPLRQLKDITPVVCLWAWAGGIRTLLRWRTADWRDRLLAATGMPVLIFFMFISATRNVKGYWTGPGYMSVLILCAATVARGGPWGRRLHLATIALLGLIYVALPIYVATVPVEMRRSWTRLGEEVAKRPADFVLCNDYHLASELAFVRRSLDVWDLSPAGKSVKSFANWWVPGSYLGKNATLVYSGRLSAIEQEQVAAAFERLDPPEEVKVLRAQLWGPKDPDRYFIQRAWNYKGTKTVERIKTEDE
jgi:4-amino-4-deoxy-L-arabinose transferase-like glycosyltransferase